MLSDNAPRFSRGGDHVESWFLRAVHPTEPRALWLKATVFSHGERRLAEVWCSLFDGARTTAVKATVPLREASFSGEPLHIELGGCVFHLDPRAGVLQGSLGEVSWDLRFARVEGALGEPLCLLPSRRLIHTSFPKNKLLTPAPVARFDGVLGWGDEGIEVEGWWGSQGHNWGRRHAPEYAWGQCVFVDAQGAPFAYAEGASGRLLIAGRQSPLLSLLTVRLGEEEHRFDGLVDLWRQSPALRVPSWSLSVRGGAGEAALAMAAAPERMVCLGYDNPGAPRSYCLNSKTARVELRVNPVDEPGFSLVSAHGGALEFLQSAEHPLVQPVV